MSYQITAKELKSLLAKWDKEALDELRDGQCIDVETGELTGGEWVPVTEASRPFSTEPISIVDTTPIRRLRLS